MSILEDKTSQQAQAYLKVKHDKDAIYFYDSRLRGKVSYNYEISGKAKSIEIIVKDARPVIIEKKKVKVIKYNFNYID